MQTMIRPLKNNLEVLQFPGLAGNCNISHFITTRQGGVSTGAYAQMNPGLYTDDCPDSIRKTGKYWQKVFNCLYRISLLHIKRIRTGLYISTQPLWS